VELCGTVGFGFELGASGGGEKVGVEKISADEGFELGEGVGGRVVFRDVAGGVPPDEREVGTAFEGDGTDEQVFERGVGTAVFTQGELRERSVTEGSSEQIEKTIAGVEWRHVQRSEAGGR
jgi:hypothetical protein